MKEKQKKIVITFHTTEEAMEMERECKAAGIEGRLIPVPRNLSPSCGLAWSMPLRLSEAIAALMEKQALKYDRVHAVG